MIFRKTNTAMNKKYLLLTTVIAATSLSAPTQARTLQYPTVPARETISIKAAASEKELQNAKSFVKAVADEGISFLSNDSLSKEQQISEFKKILKKSFSMKSIARFSLGRYWKSATKKEQAEYMDLFEKMVLNVYANRFSDYTGQELQITGAKPQGKRDILVNSLIVSNKENFKIKVDWRIRSKNGQNKIIDIIVEGVSMSVTQRSEFASIIQRGGGKVEALLKELRKR